MSGRGGGGGGGCRWEGVKEDLKRTSCTYMAEEQCVHP